MNMFSERKTDILFVFCFAACQTQQDSAESAETSKKK